MLYLNAKLPILISDSKLVWYYAGNSDCPTNSEVLNE